jgi:hypothetical protein
LTTLHVAKDGKAAAVLLRSGCRCLETRDFENGMTPLQWAAFNNNVELLAVLHAWGASNQGSTENQVGKNSLRAPAATDIALWNTVPERPQGNLCWLVLHDLIPLTRFIGIQFMKSAKVQSALERFGVEVTTPCIPMVHQRKSPGDGHRESSIRGEGGGGGGEGEGEGEGEGGDDGDMGDSERFQQNMKATFSAKSDVLEIKYLPAEYKADAHLFDTDASGNIGIGELKKIIRIKERLKLVQGDHDILCDTNRFNAIGGGDSLVQCQQRALHHHNSEYFDPVNRQDPRMAVEMDATKYLVWVDPETLKEKITTSTMHLPFTASMPLSTLNFAEKEVKGRQEERKRRKREQNPSRSSSHSNIDTNDDDQMEREAAGGHSGMSQMYGAESGDAPGWLKMTPLGVDRRSEDALKTYMATNHDIALTSEPKSYHTAAWKHIGSGWQEKIPAPNNVFERTLKSVSQNEAEEDYNEQPLGLWRPTGNRCVMSGITEEDHICMKSNPSSFKAVQLGNPLEYHRKLHPSKFTSHR